MPVRNPEPKFGKAGGKPRGQSKSKPYSLYEVVFEYMRLPQTKFIRSFPTLKALKAETRSSKVYLVKSKKFKKEFTINYNQPRLAA